MGDNCGMTKRPEGMREILERTEKALIQAHELVIELREHFFGCEPRAGGADSPRPFNGLRLLMDDNLESADALVKELSGLFDRLEPGRRDPGDIPHQCERGMRLSE